MCHAINKSRNFLVQAIKIENNFINLKSNPHKHKIYQHEQIMRYHVSKGCLLVVLPKSSSFYAQLILNQRTMHIEACSATS
jgi:hypothetical protein